MSTHKRLSRSNRIINGSNRHRYASPVFTTRLWLCSLLLTLLSGCLPGIHKPGATITAGQLLAKQYITPDGVHLPVTQWLPQPDKTSAVLVAIHGFNDYNHFFQQPGDYFQQRGIACYAYDQRGFGGSPLRGLWSGIDAYIQDLDVFVQLVKDKHPGLPVYLLGESMGGAVIIAAMTKTAKIRVNGLILAAPAVWARATMPWYQQGLLWTLAHTLPWLTLTGKGIKVMPSDNIAMLRALGKDPLVIKATRVETLYGLADLMDIAQQNAGRINEKTLVLYGDRDEIIPRQPTYQFVQHMLQAQQQKKMVALYKNGYHMLLRDLQAPVLWQDIIAWIQSPSAPLPSGADKYAQQVLGL
ncbi:MAG: lysophospholipase [Methylovulum sp.]|nr:lysophospholipase [Methylovulum sp.]